MENLSAIIEAILFVSGDPVRADALAHAMNLTVSELNEALASILYQEYDGENVKLLHSKKVRIVSDEGLAWTRDGEDGGVCSCMETEVCRRAVRLLV